MKISRSAGYGLLAVGYIAQHRDKKIILSNTISEKYDIPLEYLLKIMQQLVRVGVLRSKRGPRGGMMTEHAPREKFCIKAGKVYENATNVARRVLKSTKLSDLI